MKRPTTSDFGSALRRAGTPVTLVLIGLMGVSFVLGFLGVRAVYDLALSGAFWTSQPWTILLYPFGPNAGGLGLFWTLLSALWLYSFGSWVERDQGSVRYGVVWLIFTLFGAGLAILAFSFRIGLVGLYGPLLPASAITMVWCARNPTAQIMLWGLVPLSGKWLAWLTAAFVLFGTGQGAPLAGALMCIPLLLAWLWASERLPVAYSARRVGKKKEEKKVYQNIDAAMDRQREREERDRLRKLFESSIEDDPK